MNIRKAKGNARAASQPCPVVARIIAADGGAAERLHPGCLKRTAEQERAPCHGPSVIGRQRLDVERCKVSIGRTEVEPEFNIVQGM